jgi:hypothetical protein
MSNKNGVKGMYHETIDARNYCLRKTYQHISFWPVGVAHPPLHNGVTIPFSTTSAFF